MSNKRTNIRIKVLNAFMLAGALLWAATILTRETSMIQHKAVQWVTGIMPNFAVVWLGFGLLYTFYPLLFKREFNWRSSFLWVVGILCVLIASEVVHYLFLDAQFDILDIAASAVAALLILIVLWLTGQEV